MQTTRTIALVLLAGCGSADARESLVTIDTLPGGIPNVTTTAPVAQEGWALRHVRDVGPAPGEPGELVDPQDLALADDGTLYVVEQGPATLNVYDSTGRWQRTIGRDGSGPGEFTAAFIAVRGDTLVLQDPAQSRVTVYRASTGEVLSTRPSTCCFWAPIEVDARGGAWLPTSPPADSGGTPQRAFLRVPLAGGDADTILVPQAAASGALPRWHVTGPGGRMQFSMSVPMTPRALEAVDPSGGLVTGFAADYRLRRTTDGRDTVSLFGRPFTPVPITGATKQALVDARVAQQLAANNGLDEAGLRRAFDASLIPDVRPAFDWVYVDREGRVFALRTTADTTTVHLDLFDRQGVWLAELTVPEPGWARQLYTPVALSRDHLAIATTDPDGLPVIRIYQLTSEAQ